jgi:hypothetical protein
MPRRVILEGFKFFIRLRRHRIQLKYAVSRL